MDKKGTSNNKITMKSNKTYLCFKDNHDRKTLFCPEIYYYLLFNIIFKQLVMKMLRKFFLPAILFGTLLVSTSIGFVSCSDDYDDTALSTLANENSSSIDDLQTTATSLQSQLDALSEAQGNMPTTAEMNEADAAINEKIEIAKTALQTAIDEVQASSDTKLDADEVANAITTAITENNLVDTDDLATAISEAITANDVLDAENLSDAILTATTPIYTELEALGYYVKAMLTSIEIVTDQTSESWYYGTVIADTNFGPNNEITLTAGQEINVLSMELYAIANPSNVDWSLYDISLVNSVGTVLPVIKFGTPEANTKIFTKAATTTSSINNIWKMTTTLDWDDVSEEKDLYNDYMLSEGSPVEFYLTATSEDPERSIQSDNTITFDREVFTPVSGLTLTADPMVSEFNKDVEFALYDGPDPIIGSATPVYKKYITVDESQYDAESFTGLNTLMDNDDPITVQCTNEEYKNKTITFTVHYLNYDGTVGEASTDVIFAQLAYEDHFEYLNSTINFSLPYNAQESQPSDIADFKTLVGGSISDYITDNDISSIEVTSYYDDENEIKELPSSGVVNFTNSSNNTVSVSVPSTISSTEIAANINETLSNITISYSAENGQVDKEGKYGVELTFINSTGITINHLFLIMTVNAATDGVTSKVTNAWSNEFTQANVWANIDETTGETLYDMNLSYNNELTYMSFKYNEGDNLMSFNNDQMIISTPSGIADKADQNYSVTSSYNGFGLVTCSGWDVDDDFNIHMRSPIYEAEPAYASGFDNSLIYTSTTASDEILTIGVNDIIATDPSVNNYTIHYIGSMDNRIEKIVYTIQDSENSGSINNNLGYVQFDNGTLEQTITNPGLGVTSSDIIIESAALNNTEYPALSDDVTLQLVMTVYDKFGFNKSYSFDFTVTKNQNN